MYRNKFSRDFMYRKKFSRFSVKPYRKLEIMLLIFRGYCSVDALLSELRFPRICRSTLYKLLRNYRVQGLIKIVNKKARKKNRHEPMRVAITRKGMRWLGHMLLKEYCLLREEGITTAEVDNYINELVLLLNGSDAIDFLYKVMLVRKRGMTIP